MAATGKIAKRIWNFLESLGAGVIFTTRLLLSLANRNTIDKNLSRLKNKGLISYLADGVYMLPDENAEPPSAFEIIQAKAKAFHKLVCKATLDTHVFDTDGCKSSFNSIHGRLHFRAVSPKKIREQTRASMAKRSAPAKKTGWEKSEPRSTQERNVQGNSLVSLISKMQELIARAEERLNLHLDFGRRNLLRHSISLQHF